MDNSKKEHILIVEDELVIAQILTEYLNKNGFRSTHLSDGSKVISLVKSDPPDLVLLDLMLPGKDGLEVCKEIRSISAVPIFMVTAKVEEIDRLLGLELGADDYICKPFSPREVVARVKALFRRMKQSSLAEQKRQGFEVDEIQQRISFEGNRLDLTPTEFRLLKLFVSNPGRVYSRSQLLDLCYQQEQLIVDRVIDSHIKNLRKKIAKVLPEGKEVIHAVYGIGYRYEFDS
ncbi:MAG: response regulator [Candidatus Obscuribacterales bacterium]|nr:response regulator [Candidatus Obscuribacterales bacterium]